MRSIALLIVLVALAVGSQWYLDRPLAEERIDAAFTLCGPGRGHACVVDGDTIKLGERKIRMLGIDAPEIVEPRCPAERERGLAAQARLRDLLDRGPIWLVTTADRNRDDYGRDLRRIEVADGDKRRDVGDIMIRENLAVRYDGAKADWC